MIELSHVTKTFGGKKALDELSLRVPQGAVYGLIGSNGAGKSTAIRHLTGIYRPDAGTSLTRCARSFVWTSARRCAAFPKACRSTRPSG